MRPVRRSRTATLPLVTRVSVPSQRSDDEPGGAAHGDDAVAGARAEVPVAVVAPQRARRAPARDRGGAGAAGRARGQRPAQHELGHAVAAGGLAHLEEPAVEGAGLGGAARAARLCSFTLPARVSTIEPTGTEAPSASAAAGWSPPARARGPCRSPARWPRCARGRARPRARARARSRAAATGRREPAAGAARGLRRAAERREGHVRRPCVTPRSLEATRRTWYVVAGCEAPDAWR